LLYLETDSSTSPQSPSTTKETVVAPLWPKFEPMEPLCRVLRKPLPQPPPQQPWAAVVESPARKNAGGPWTRLCCGDAVVRYVFRRANKESGMRDLMMAGVVV
jgi:hypothetical protein